MGGKEKNQSIIRIEYINAKVAHDVILSLYNHPVGKINSTTKYLLEMFKCRSFFCLDNDVKLLYNLDISKEEFDLFMHVVEEFDLVNDEYLLKTIKKNIPLDYDLNNFSMELINKLRFNDNLRIVSGSGDCSLKIWDAESGQLLNTLTSHTNSVLSVAFSSDNLKIVSGPAELTRSLWRIPPTGG
jgi:WD40 repeat protein